jgi:hypothetical protein
MQPPERDKGYLTEKRPYRTPCLDRWQHTYQTNRSRKTTAAMTNKTTNTVSLRAAAQRLHFFFMLATKGWERSEKMAYI